MSTLTVDPAYAELPSGFAPRIIRSEDQNRRAIEALYALEQHQDRWTEDEADLADLLTLLIEDYEEKHCQLPRASPVELLRFLMEQHNLKQKDLAPLFGTPSLVSEVLHGKRELTKQQIRRLSERFHVSPELFF